jgi:hypothetical protein
MKDWACLQEPPKINLQQRCVREKGCKKHRTGPRSRTGTLLDLHPEWKEQKIRVSPRLQAAQKQSRPRHLPLKALHYLLRALRIKAKILALPTKPYVMWSCLLQPC